MMKNYESLKNYVLCIVRIYVEIYLHAEYEKPNTIEIME